MLNILKYLFIGFIQGITEFLPISSSGHIVLFGSLFEMDNLMLVSIVAHIGTLFAVIYCYRERLKILIKKPFCNTNINLILATIPACVIALLFNKFLEKNFSTKTLIWGFLASAVALVIADFKKKSYKPITKRSAIYMGISQGLALLPGISRSGSTLVCGLLSGVEKEEALDFSFLMSIPIILASAVWETIKLFTCHISINWFEIFIVLISSFIFGILSIKIMLKTIKNNKLYIFSIYLILLSFILAICY